MVLARPRCRDDGILEDRNRECQGERNGLTRLELKAPGDWSEPRPRRSQLVAAFREVGEDEPAIGPAPDGEVDGAVEGHRDIGQPGPRRIHDGAGELRRALSRRGVPDRKGGNDRTH